MKINKKLSYDKIDGKIIIMNDTDDLFCKSKALILNDSATYIFECLRDTMNINTIKKRIIENFGIDENIAKSDLEKCINYFINMRILIDD